MVSYMGTGIVRFQGEHSNKCLFFLMGASGLFSPVVCKLEHKSESPGRLVNRQTAHPAMMSKNHINDQQNNSPVGCSSGTQLGGDQSSLV